MYKLVEQRGESILGEVICSSHLGMSIKLVTGTSAAFRSGPVMFYVW